MKKESLQQTMRKLKLILLSHNHPDIKTKEKNQINKIRNEKEEVTTDNAEIQRIIRDYHEQLSGI